MPNWLAVMIGVIIGGGIQMLADWLRHLRYPAERTIEQVIERRLTAYSDLWGGLMRAFTSAPSFPYEAEDSTVTKALKKEMVEVGALLLTNDIWLSPKIAQISWKYLPAIEHLVLQLEHGALDNKEELQNLLFQLLTEIGEGINEELKAARVETLLMAQRKDSMLESHKILQNIAAKEKAKAD